MTAYAPKDRNIIKFQGNTAHSCGFWWIGSGCIYVGGELKHQTSGDTTKLEYHPWRITTPVFATCDDNTRVLGYCPRGKELWPKFEDVKVWLTNGKGMQHWGSRSEIIRIEVADADAAASVFGTVYVNGLLANGRTGHLPEVNQGCLSIVSTNCNQRDRRFNTAAYQAFEWYVVFL
jgi:hypothetical protein